MKRLAILTVALGIAACGGGDDTATSDSAAGAMGGAGAPGTTGGTGATGTRRP